MIWSADIYTSELYSYEAHPQVLFKDPVLFTSRPFRIQTIQIVKIRQNIQHKEPGKETPVKPMEIEPTPATMADMLYLVDVYGVYGHKSVYMSNYTLFDYEY